MFGRRKEELQLMQKTLERFEDSQKATELMLSSISELAEIKKAELLQTVDAQKMRETEITEEMKRQAAYALNLCTVSVSQIIDYNDENILEQEYETILNNLNLENMPKDEPLLNVLKQILDTVTFFRIQKGDKALIEKEYQQKMKNAIWSAVPNIGLIVAGGNPFTMALSLASQVGIGYMNYRKTKAENSLEKEREEWKLQRAAIEQLDGLRRELFDASWRLADRYGFSDNLRLTERQITQYNNILMDTDDIRRYERLESISQCFDAYPAFWYHYGHAANLIAQKMKIEGEYDLYIKYRNLSISHFEMFLDCEKHNLLREDHITSSCALEAFELLQLAKDDEIGIVFKYDEEYLLDKAVAMSGKANDIIQLCAISYMKIGKVKDTTTLLAYLVNERYNTVMNAQLLSSIYAAGIIANNNQEYLLDYKMLARRIPDKYMFPLPKNGEAIDELKDNFLNNQKRNLGEKYKNVVMQYIERKTIAFNKIIPAPMDKEYEDSFYLDNDTARQDRLSLYENLFSNDSKAEDFGNRLAETNFALSILEILNQIVNDVEHLVPGDEEKKLAYIEGLVNEIESKIADSKKNIETLQGHIHNGIKIDGFMMLFKMNLEHFTGEFFEKLLIIILNHICGLNDMSALMNYEMKLKDFCSIHNLQEPDSYSDSVFVEEEAKIYFTSDLMGGQASRDYKTNQLARKMLRKIESYIENIILPAEKQKNYLYAKWGESKYNYKKYVSKHKLNKSDNRDIQVATFAVLVNDVFGGADLIFTTEGLLIPETLFNDQSIISYSDCKKENDDYILLGNVKYKNKGVNLSVLISLLQELSGILSFEKTAGEKEDRSYRLAAFNKEVQLIGEKVN